MKAVFQMSGLRGKRSIGQVFVHFLRRNGYIIVVVCFCMFALNVCHMINSLESSRDNTIATTSLLEINERNHLMNKYTMVSQSVSASSAKKRETVEVDQCRNTTRKVINYSMSGSCSNYASASRYRYGFHNQFQRQFQIVQDILSRHEKEIFSGKESSQNDKKVITTLSIPNVLCQAKALSKDITLTTQIGVDKGKMRRLAALAMRWNGPLSVAIRITSKEELQKLQEEMIHFMDDLRKVAFHFYFEDGSNLYPNNILRNIALDQTTSDYFALFDVDFFPSPINTHEHLQTVLHQNPQISEKLDDKVAFVLPAFELLEKIPGDEINSTHELYPETKEDIIDNENIQRFHWNTAPQGHRSTKYDRWMKKNDKASYPIQIQEYGYEPYIIASKKNVPRFFNEFRGLGINKLSFYADLQYSKYKFEVLSDFFVFHVFHSSSYGNQQQRSLLTWKSKKCISSFMAYLEKTYGAGHLDKKDEMVDYDVWVMKMKEGLLSFNEYFHGEDSGTYNQFYWKDLPPLARKAAEKLAFDEISWDKGFWSSVGSKKWHDMTTEEKESLETLGYFEKDWYPKKVM